jgi:hypothetical protein
MIARHALLCSGMREDPFMLTVRIAVSFALVLGMAACSTRTPVVVITPEGGRVLGTATTSVYTGKVDAGDGRCVGYYNGRISDPIVPLTLTCPGPRLGYGTAVIQNGHLVSGTARTPDGRQMHIGVAR